MKYRKASYVLLVLFELVSVLLFSQGYFSMRVTLPNQNEIPSQNDDPKNVVMLIIDSLRADMIDNLPFAQEMIQNNPNKSLLFVSKVEIPTITTFKLKSLGGGIIPATQFNMNSNFSVTEKSQILEDNFLWQLKKHNKSSVFMGDESWEIIYPGQFTRSFPNKYSDLDDFNTTDEIVFNNIIPTIQKNDAQLIIGHVLGVDHMSHRYDINYHLIVPRLRQYSDIIQQIYEQMNDNTVLIITGDHGIQDDGNHGGPSEQATNSMIFAAYKGEKQFYRAYKPDQQYEKPKDLQKFPFIRKVSQIDLAPTISYLLGVPIPFSNLGMVIPEFQLVKEQQSQKEQIKLVAKSVQENLHQVQNYLELIQKTYNKYPQSFYQQSIDQIHSLLSMNENDFDLQKVQIAQQLIGDIQITSNKLWNDFDTELMQMAIINLILLTLLSIQLMRCYYYDIKIEENAMNSDLELTADKQTKYRFGMDKIVKLLALFLCLMGVYLLHHFNMHKFVAALIFLFTVLLFVETQRRIKQMKQTNVVFFQDVGQDLSQFQNNGLKDEIFKAHFVELVAWFFYIIGHAVILLTLYMIHFIDQSLFILFSTGLILYLIITLIQKLKNSNKINHSMITQYLALCLITMIVAEQYDKHFDEDRYLISSIRIRSLQSFVMFYPIKILIPSYLALKIVQSYLNFLERQLKSNLKLHKNIGLIIITMISILYLLQEIIDEETIKNFEIFIQLIIILGLVIGIQNSLHFDEIKIELFILYVSLGILLTSGPLSIAVLDCFVVCLYSLWKANENTITRTGPFFLSGAIAVALNYFWLMLGNRPQISVFNFDKLGYDYSQVFWYGTLTAINKSSILILTVLIISLFNKMIDSKSKGSLKIGKQLLLLLFQIPFAIQVMITCIHCSINLDGLYLERYFPQKLFIDIYIFGVVSLATLVG